MVSITNIMNTIQQIIPEAMCKIPCLIKVEAKHMLATRDYAAIVSQCRMPYQEMGSTWARDVLEASRMGQLAAGNKNPFLGKYMPNWLRRWHGFW